MMPFFAETCSWLQGQGRFRHGLCGYLGCEVMLREWDSEPKDFKPRWQRRQKCLPDVLSKQGDSLTEDMKYDGLKKVLQERLPGFRIGDVLGVGGISVCFAAKTKRSSEALAIKVTHKVPRDAEDGEWIADMAEVGAALDSLQAL